MKLRLVAAAGLSGALLLTACGGDDTTETPADNNTGVETTEAPADDNTAESAPEDTASEDSNGGGSEEPFTMPEGTSGTLTGTGASSMKNAQTAWVAKFIADNPSIQTVYNPEGSGAGVTAITDGTAQWAGSDGAISVEDNKAGAFASCASDSIVYNLPVYISPVAVVFNVEGVDELNLDPTTLAKIFKGEITSWDDEAIAALNDGVELPAENITVVHRSDESGTTENFTDYLFETAPDVWDAEPDKTWPYDNGTGGEKTDGVKAGVENGQFTIGYVDASAAGDLSVASIGSEGNFAKPTPEAAASVVENSPIEEGRQPNDLAFALDREAEGYPIVLISYAVACAKYDDENDANMVKGYLTFITSEEGQQLGAESAGSAPLSEGLRSQVVAAINSIQ